MRLLMKKKNSKVFICHYGRQVMILKEKKAEQLLKKLSNATPETK